MEVKYIYCNVCKTISAVELTGQFPIILPKLCKCQCKEKGVEWVDDEELKRVFKK